jgi:acyl-CoA reductase-like NAD-dependent aldehyde dehydrogenase
MDEHTTLAPLSSERALQTAMEQIEIATKNGAKVLLGGKRIDGDAAFSVRVARSETPIPVRRPSVSSTERPR